MAKPTNQYVDNKKFHAAFLDHKKKVLDAKAAGKREPAYSDYIGKCILDIAQNLALLPKFSGYTFREEMIGDAVENCIMYAHNFDPEKYDNPFAYFTKITYYAFLRRIMKEKKQTYIKYKSTEKFGIFDALDNLDAEGIIKSPFEMYENMVDFIHEYENKSKTVKVAKAAKVREKKVRKVRGLETFMVE